MDTVREYLIRTHGSPDDIDAGRWNALLDRQSEPTPFLRHEYLVALHLSGSATADSGWLPRITTVELDGELVAGTWAYIKSHSYGEYVFDWAWADAYRRHGLRYYPKLLAAIPFTPVPGARLLAIDESSRAALVAALRQQAITLQRNSPTMAILA